MSPEAERPISRALPAQTWTELVQRVHDGDPGALEDLYRIFASGVRFHLRRHLGSRDLDDKVHDVFLVVTQAIQRGDLRDPERLMGYVHTIVKRQVALHIGDTVQERRNHSDFEIGSFLRDQHPNPERQIIAEELTEVALRILNSLKKRDREVLIRFYLKEQSQDQICREMELTETQFRLIKSRAKARFGVLGKRRMERKKGFQP